MSKFLMLAVAAALIFAACGGDDDGDGDGSGATSPESQLALYGTQTAVASGGGPDAQPPGALDETPSPQAQPTQPTQGGPVGQYSAEPPMTIDANKTYTATIKMDIGDIKLELYPKDAPRHVNNFVFLAREGFYDGVTFHRVIAGFMAQAGDPTGTGSGGPGYNIPDEFNSRQFVDGTLGMAKTNAPDSAGSQWFICFARAAHLDGGYTNFGQLIEGREVLAQIQPRDPNSATAPGVRINTIEIAEQ